MNTTRTPSTTCPSCSRCLDAASHLSREVAPKPGDLTVCAYCAMPLRFGPALELQAMSVEDLRELEPAERQELLRVVMHVMHAGALMERQKRGGQ